MKIGVLGGGQLGKMLALSGIPLGHEFVFLDPASDACAATAGAHIVGDLSDKEALNTLAEQVDIVTYEFENLPLDSVQYLEEKLAVYPSSAALEVTQDRLLEKSLCRELGIATAQFANVESEADLQPALSEIGLPSILKTRRMGYDGKGQCVLRTGDDAAGATSLCSQACILEQMVAFEREVSIIATRSRDGDIVYYPLTENVHQESILHTSRAPAEVDASTEETARDIAQRLLSHFEYVGTLAIEFFLMADGQLLVNEMAPRVHNSGHWTIEGAQASQFENHIRAISGMSLGSPAPCGHSGMVNIIGTFPDTEELMETPGVHVHLYGKEERPKRKIGHITVCYEDEQQLSAAMEHVENVVRAA